jgi:hypothetical protein
MLRLGLSFTRLSSFPGFGGIDVVSSHRWISTPIHELVDVNAARAQARTTKDWARSDALRAELAAIGMEVRDTPAGQRWVRKDLLAPDSRDPSDPTSDHA